MRLDEVRARILELAVDATERLVDRHLPDLRIPSVFAGHRVEPDVAADLAFTLCHLRDAGVGEVASVPIEEAVARALRQVDGERTHSFWSYRVAESLNRFGSFDQNALIGDWPEPMRAELERACDTTSFVELLDSGLLPRNYAAVIARCELGRARLGIIDDPRLLDDLVTRTRMMLSASPQGFLDDSTTGVGRYDIYTADVYLFTEPLAQLLGPVWDHGARGALDLVAKVGSTDGSAVTWGRSTGALAACLTMELAALAIDRSIGDGADRWLTRALVAVEHFDRWFNDGLITAHQYRSTYGYRGTQRRLQMTLDVLGKLAYSAATLQRADPGLQCADRNGIHPDSNHLISFSQRPIAAVWAYRSRDCTLVVPFVGSTRSDYLPAPHNPGLYEVPVDSGIASLVPLVFADGRAFTVGGPPDSIRLAGEGVSATYTGLPRTGELEIHPDPQSLPGIASLRYRVEGRRLVVDEEIHLHERPEAVSVLVCETAQRPLHVRFVTEADHDVQMIDTAGLEEYRSFWAELPRVHQLDMEPSESIVFSLEITPKLRVASTAFGHHYHRSLYEPIRDFVVDMASPLGPLAGRADDEAEQILDQVDLFHLHWPEWLAFDDVDEHRRIISRLRESGVRIIWTQHNLTPHSDDSAAFDTIYQAWASAADGVIHQSEWGRYQSLDRYAFGDDVIEDVIPHGHFGPLMGEIDRIDRREAEADLGLGPCALRIGIIGAPRTEKRVQDFMEGFAATRRPDVELLVLSLREGERVPDDPRIKAIPYEMVSRAEYNRRLRTLDVVAFPFSSEGMLATGTIGDVIGLGLPALVSGWPFLSEMLRDAGIPCGLDPAEVTRVVEGLDAETLERAAAASRALQSCYDWSVIAQRTLDLFERVGTTRL